MAEIDRDKLLDIYTRTMKVNRTDEKFRELLMGGKVAVMYYCVRGQELVSAAAMAALSDVMQSLYNGHFSVRVQAQVQGEFKVTLDRAQQATEALKTMIDSLMLSVARITTIAGTQVLTNASGFFFARDERLFLVTSRHVMIDAQNQHFPDRIEIELHSDPDNIAQSIGISIPLYRDGHASMGAFGKYSCEAFGLGDTDYWHYCFDMKLSSDLMWLAARLRAA